MPYSATEFLNGSCSGSDPRVFNFGSVADVVLRSRGVTTEKTPHTHDGEQEEER